MEIQTESDAYEPTVHCTVCKLHRWAKKLTILSLWGPKGPQEFLLRLRKFKLLKNQWFLELCKSSSLIIYWYLIYIELSYLKGNVEINQRGVPNLVPTIKMAHGPCIHECFQWPEYEKKIFMSAREPLWFTPTLPLKDILDKIIFGYLCQITTSSFFYQYIACISLKVRLYGLVICRSPVGV